MSKSIVRGGQLSLHNLRMLRQVSLMAILISLALGMGYSALKFKKKMPSYLIEQYVQSYRADFASLYSKETFEQSEIDWPESSGTRKVWATDLVGSSYVKNLRNYIEYEVQVHFMEGLRYTLYVFLILVFLWFLKGKRSFLSKRLRGQKIISPFWLAFKIYLKRKASNIKVGWLPLIKGAEVKHILTLGTTGAGKTNLLNTLLPQIRKRGDKALIMDTTGDMVSKYYDPARGDILLNPFDARSLKWDLLNDVTQEYQFDSMAKSIVPQNQGYSDPMWKNGSAKLLSVALQKAKDQKISLEALYDILACDGLLKFGGFFYGTDAFVFADPKGEKTTMSFRTTLSANISFLKHISKGRGDFSITKWVQDENQKSWIFLTANEDQLPTLRPLISAAFEVVSTTLMSLKESDERRLWFVLDELPALQRLQSLSGILSKGRKYGACILAGLQSISQFEKEYGPHESRTILNLFNTKFFFRSTEVQTCEQISRSLGDEEIEETNENLSYGAHQMRDGISLGQQKKQRRLVLPTEISQLPDLTCYVKYPEGLPLTKLKMAYKNVKEEKAPFILNRNQ